MVKVEEYCQLFTVSEECNEYLICIDYLHHFDLNLYLDGKLVHRDKWDAYKDTIYFVGDKREFVNKQVLLVRNTQKDLDFDLHLNNHDYHAIEKALDRITMMFQEIAGLPHKILGAEECDVELTCVERDELYSKSSILAWNYETTVPCARLERTDACLGFGYGSNELELNRNVESPHQFELERTAIYTRKQGILPPSPPQFEDPSGLITLTDTEFQIKELKETTSNTPEVTLATAISSSGFLGYWNKDYTSGTSDVGSLNSKSFTFRSVTYTFAGILLFKSSTSSAFTIYLDKALPTNPSGVSLQVDESVSNFFRTPNLRRGETVDNLLSLTATQNMFGYQFRVNYDTSGLVVGDKLKFFIQGLTGIEYGESSGLLPIFQKLTVNELRSITNLKTWGFINKDFTSLTANRGVFSNTSFDLEGITYNIIVFAITQNTTNRMISKVEIILDKKLVNVDGTDYNPPSLSLGDNEFEFNSKAQQGVIGYGGATINQAQRSTAYIYEFTASPNPVISAITNNQMFNIKIAGLIGSIVTLLRSTIQLPEITVGENATVLPISFTNKFSTATRANVKWMRGFLLSQFIDTIPNNIGRGPLISFMHNSTKVYILGAFTGYRTSAIRTTPDNNFGMFAVIAVPKSLNKPTNNTFINYTSFVKEVMIDLNYNIDHEDVSMTVTYSTDSVTVEGVDCDVAYVGWKSSARVSANFHPQNQELMGLQTGYHEEMLHTMEVEDTSPLRTKEDILPDGFFTYEEESEIEFDAAREIDELNAERLWRFYAVWDPDTSTFSQVSEPLIATSTKQYYTVKFILSNGQTQAYCVVYYETGYTVDKKLMPCKMLECITSSSDYFAYQDTQKGPNPPTEPEFNEPIRVSYPAGEVQTLSLLTGDDRDKSQSLEDGLKAFLNRRKETFSRSNHVSVAKIQNRSEQVKEELWGCLDFDTHLVRRNEEVCKNPKLRIRFDNLFPKEGFKNVKGYFNISVKNPICIPSITLDLPNGRYYCYNYISRNKNPDDKFSRDIRYDIEFSIGNMIYYQKEGMADDKWFVAYSIKINHAINPLKEAHNSISNFPFRDILDKTGLRFLIPFKWDARRLGVPLFTLNDTIKNTVTELIRPTDDLDLRNKISMWEYNRFSTEVLKRPRFFKQYRYERDVQLFLNSLSNNLYEIDTDDYPVLKPTEKMLEQIFRQDRSRAVDALAGEWLFNPTILRTLVHENQEGYYENERFRLEAKQESIAKINIANRNEFEGGHLICRPIPDPPELKAKGELAGNTASRVFINYTPDLDNDRSLTVGPSFFNNQNDILLRHQINSFGFDTETGAFSGIYADDASHQAYTVDKVNTANLHEYWLTDIPPVIDSGSSNRRFPNARLQTIVPKWTIFAENPRFFNSIDHILISAPYYGVGTEYLTAQEAQLGWANLEQTRTTLDPRCILSPVKGQPFEKRLPYIKNQKIPIKRTICGNACVISPLDPNFSMRWDTYFYPRIQLVGKNIKPKKRIWTLKAGISSTSLDGTTYIAQNKTENVKGVGLGVGFRAIRLDLYHNRFRQPIPVDKMNLERCPWCLAINTLEAEGATFLSGPKVDGQVSGPASPHRRNLFPQIPFIRHERITIGNQRPIGPYAFVALRTVLGMPLRDVKFIFPQDPNELPRVAVYFLIP